MERILNDISKNSIPIDVESGRSQRVDGFLAHAFAPYSRTYFKDLIVAGYVYVNGERIAKPSVLIHAGDVIAVDVPALRDVTDYHVNASLLPVRLVHEHEHFLIVSKPAGLVVHKPHGQSDEITLVDWLMYFYKEIAKVGAPQRPGIVHRLDKDTSGLMLIARTPYAHTVLSSLFKERKITKVYTALVDGKPSQSGSIDFRIDRHPVEPTKMTHRTGSGREALTDYHIIEYFNNHALVEFRPHTGRTHQIRVHAAAIGHSLVGDAVYGSSSKIMRRHALHASGLSFEFEGKMFEFADPLPADFNDAVNWARHNA